MRKLRNWGKLQDRSSERQGACLVTAPFRRHSVEFSCCIGAGIENHPAMVLHRVLKPRAQLENADRCLRDSFQALAADALKDNRASFLDLAKMSCEGYQKPIAESLNRVDQRLQDAERERGDAY